MSSYMIVIFGWSPGFKKIETTKYLQSEFGMQLSEAKGCVDNVLHGEQVILTGNFSQQSALLFRDRLTALGAKCEVKQKDS